MREVFERSEFRQDRSWIERLLDWIARQLSRLGGGGGTAPAYGGALGNVVMWIALTILVVFLVALAWYVVRNRRSFRRHKPVAEEVDVTEQLTPKEWRSAAEAHEAAGEWKEAIRCRYRELVARLVQRGVAPPQPGRTTGELRVDVAGSAPAAGSDFDRATLLFELPWYADAPTGPDENQRFRELAERVMEETR